MTAPDRCESTARDIRCEEPAGHDGIHFAQTTNLSVGWPNARDWTFPNTDTKAGR